MRIALGILAAVLVVGLAIVVLGVVQPFEDDEDARAEASVDAIVEAPPPWYRKAVELTAPAIPVDEDRFVLEGDEQAIVVHPEPDAVEGEIERGEQVTVRGFVHRLDRLQVSELRALLRGGHRPLLREAPTALGDPYVLAEYVDARG
ncbi:MAG: hypothetical protein KY433_07820 [Actinobacteria bacterium]|nr:hypothetical protein [Actinomycetota bacterium]